MYVGRVLLACAAVGGVLLLSVASASALRFVPEGAHVTGEGGEAKFFANQIACKKTKLVNALVKKELLFASKVEGTMEFLECKYGLLKIENFVSNAFAIEASERVSFRTTTMKTEKGGCTINIEAPMGLNLMLSRVLLANTGLLRTEAEINVPGTGTGLLYNTSKGAECGLILKEDENKPTTFTDTVVLNGTNVE